MPVSDLSVSYNCIPHRLMGVAAAVMAFAGLAGCSSNETRKDDGTIAWSQPGTVAPAGTTTGSSPVPSGPPLDWRTSLSGDIVTVEVRDTNDFYRIERVELVGPNGITVAASEVDRETNRSSGDSGGSYGPSVGLGVGSWSGSGHRGSGSSTGVGLGLGFPLGGSSSVNSPPAVVTMTRARIRIPDPAFYRDTAASWVVRVTTTDRTNQSNVAVFPAPRPTT